MRIAVIAPGAMGAAVARRLRERGTDVAKTLVDPGQASAARAAGISSRDSEVALAGWADVVAELDEIGSFLANNPGAAIYPAVAGLYAAIAADHAAPAAGRAGCCTAILLSRSAGSMSAVRRKTLQIRLSDRPINQNITS